jgi:hypothetical protein
MCFWLLAAAEVRVAICVRAREQARVVFLVLTQLPQFIYQRQPTQLMSARVVRVHKTNRQTVQVRLLVQWYGSLAVVGAAQT